MDVFPSLQAFIPADVLVPEYVLSQRFGSTPVLCSGPCKTQNKP